MSHAFDMIGSLKKNRDVSASRRDRIAAIREQYIGFAYVREAQFPCTKITKEELAIVKMQIRKTLRAQKIRAIVIACIAGTLFAALLAIIIIYGTKIL